MKLSSLGVLGLLLLVTNVRAEDLVYSASNPNVAAFAPKFEVVPEQVVFERVLPLMLTTIRGVVFAPAAVFTPFPRRPIVLMEVVPEAPTAPFTGKTEELTDEEKRHVTYSMNLLFGTPTPLDPRDVKWWKGVQERRAKQLEDKREKEKRLQYHVTVNVGTIPTPEFRLEKVQITGSLVGGMDTTPITVAPPPEDGGKIWNKNIPAERAKIKDSLRDYRKALGLPIDDASLEEAVNGTKMEMTPVDREGNPVSLSPSSSSQ